ncbi:MAG: GEVED domain-containing protein, partial [Bacteroidetes bacterium]|nr:GEVED domain-containing protein [Bacteroidota bacterium]
MRKLFTLLIAFSLWAGSSWAQTTATIGAGTTTATDYGPVYNWGAANTFDYCIYNYLFLSSEIAAAGIPVGSTITKLAWSKSTAFATSGNAKFDIWIKNSTHTNQTNGVLWGTVITGSTLAYSTVAQSIPSTVGWIEFTLSTPIIYTGGSLEIATNWDISAVVGNPTTGAFLWKYSNLTFNGTVGQSSSEPLNSLSYLSAYGTGGASRPNIQITYQPTPACSGTPAPGNTLASASPICSGASLTLSLQNTTPGLGVTYNWESSSNGLAPWTSITNPDPLLITSQTNETWYRCQVTCEGNTGISTPVQVTMNNFLNCYCVSAANTVHEEDITRVQFGSTLNNTSILESLTGSQGTATGTQDFYSNFTSIPATEVKRMVMTPIAVQITQSRGLDYAFGHSVRVYIDFNQNGQFTDAGEEFNIWPYAISTTHTITGNILIPANAALGNTQMRVVCKESSTIGPCLISSWGETEDYLINIGEVPACIPPGLLAATNLTGFQATLGWLEGGSATSWDIEWGLTPFTPTGIPSLTGVTNPYVLPGLTPVTGYTFYVRANCGGSGYSAWSGPSSFTTTVACVAPTTLSATEITTTSAILGWTAPGALFDIEWGLTGFTPKGVPNVIGVANPYILNSLEPATSYQYYVRQDCGINGISLWSGPFTFVTTCRAINVLPWTEGFEDMTSVGANILPLCWSYTNILSNNNTCNGSCNSSTAHTGTKFLYGTRNFNVWNYTPGFQLTAGTSYDFSYWFKCRNTTVGYDVSLAYGTAPNVASMTNVLSNETGLNIAVWTQKSYTFTPPASGVYYFGLHTVSPNYSPLGISYDDFKLESCATPTNLSAGSITMTSASLNWSENGGATTWDIELGIAGFTPVGTPTQAAVTSRPFNYTGLSTATNYSYYVRAACGGAWGNSSWAGPFSFSTSCGVLTVPYCQDFTTAFFPACWSQTFSGITSDRWSISNTAIAGGTADEAKCTYHLGIGVSRLITPQLNTTGMSFVQLAFRQMFDDYSSGSGVTISLESRFDGGDWTAEWSHAAGINADIPAELKVLNIAVLGDSMELAWTVNGDHYNINYWYIDNVCITPLSCPPPAALTATGITTTSANLNWMLVGSETAWEYVYGVSPLAPPTGSGTATSSSTVNPISGLSSATQYQYYVRANCGAGFSAWAGPFTFTTLCSGIAVTTFPFTENFNAAVVPPLCWSEIITNTDYHWKASISNPGWADVEYDPAPASQNEWLVTPVMDFTSLSHPRLSFK